MDHKAWQQRFRIVLIGVVVLFLSLDFQLYKKAILEHLDTVKAAENQYNFRESLIGKRGDITVADSGGAYPLATDEQKYQVLVIPSQLVDAKSAAHSLAGLLSQDETALYNTINNKKPYIPPVAKMISSDVAGKITKLNLNGVVMLPEMARTYPEGSLASQLLGFVNADGIGNYGVEQSLDGLLKGVSGYLVGEQDTLGRTIKLNDQVKAQNGATVELTIDREIQFHIEQAIADTMKQFKADGMSVVVVEPKTGNIIAMASAPTFDPNNYGDVKQADQSAFNNPAVASVWEPGSVMKPLIMSLAIDKGLVQPDTADTFPASVRVGAATIWTAEKTAFGHETMTQVLENSDNVAMVWLSNKLGSDAEYKGMINFGFGAKSNVNLPGEVTGSIPPLSTWQDLTRATASFGQGVSVTPLQMAMAYSAIANGGKLLEPQIVKSVTQSNGQKVETLPKVVRQVVTADTATKTNLMLQSTVDHGIARRAGVAGYTVGAKTGTAQVPDPTGSYYADRFDGTVAGDFPVSNPQYTMIVKIDNPKGVLFAENSAAPTFGGIAAWILHQKNVTPDRPK